MTDQTPSQQQHALIYDAVNDELADLELTVVQRQMICNRAARAVLARLPEIEAAGAVN